MKNQAMETKLIKSVDAMVDALAKTSGDLTREEKDQEAVRMQEHLAQYETESELFDKWSDLFLEKGVEAPSKKAVYMLRGFGMYNPMMLRGMRNHFVVTGKMTEGQMALHTLELISKRLIRQIDDEKSRAVYWLTKLGKEMLDQIGGGG